MTQPAAARFCAQPPVEAHIFAILVDLKIFSVCSLEIVAAQVWLIPLTPDLMVITFLVGFPAGIRQITVLLEDTAEKINQLRSLPSLDTVIYRDRPACTDQPISRLSSNYERLSFFVVLSTR